MKKVQHVEKIVTTPRPNVMPAPQSRVVNTNTVLSPVVVHSWKEEWQSSLEFEQHKKLLTDNHMINIRIRKDGEWYEIDADWLKTLVRQEF